MWYTDSSEFFSNSPQLLSPASSLDLWASSCALKNTKIPFHRNPRPPPQLR